VRQGLFLLGLGLVTGATLGLEVLDTRLLSVLTWYSLAFFVIAMGLCGLTAGALRVYLGGGLSSDEEIARALSRAAREFALAVPVSYVALLILPLRTEPVATTVILFLVFSAALALPFYPAGKAIAIAVTRTRFPVGRVYAVDLAGAAIGAPLAPLALSVMDGGSAILLLGAVAALGAVLFARAGRDTRETRHGAFALAFLLALFAGNRATDHGLRPLWVKERAETYAIMDAELWNSHSRIEVFRPSTEPAMMWGLGSRCQAPVVTERVLVIDGHAATPLYHAGESLESLRFIECDVSDVGNLLKPGGSAAVIGVGGSRDIQAALLAGHAPVVGIELNDRLLEILNGPMGEPTLVAHHPDVRLIHDDARSYLSRTHLEFHVVQASLIDTWAATGAGAHALGENGLYTLEAWRTFLSRVEPGGIFTVTRWATVETSRMIALAVAALLDAGAPSPRDHIALVSGGLATTLVVGRDPLTPADTARLRQIAVDKGFVVVVAPGEHVRAERLERLLSAKSPSDIDRATLTDDLDFRPSTDDRPFFFNVVRLRSLFHALPDVTAGTLVGNLIATRMLGLTLFASLVFVLGSIVWPLYRRRRRQRTLRQDRQKIQPSLVAAFVYFCLIGIGFMLVEIALLERLSLVLGHPLYALTVVLSALVASAGLGSLLSDALPFSRAPYCFVYPLLIVGVVTVFALWWPALAPRVIVADTPVRIAWATAVTAGVGLPLGIAFPTGLSLVKRAHADETPWLWGLNGAGSVVASSLAILIALTQGLTVLTLVGAACYALLLPAIFVMVERAD
jgi:predicted membrane-bound spermidine synthase